jgi:putative redox protein
MPTERFQFTGEGGHMLAAALELPDGEPQACALFAHCFTCGKDVLAARRIAVALAAKGIAVLRFDFTGLGSSEGDFANSTFSSNVADLVRAADHLRETRTAPAILIGHSLGGAAILAAAGKIPEARAVVTIAAPSDPAHVTGLFREHLDDIRKHGEVEVTLAGRPFRIKREFLDDIAEHELMEDVTNLHKALLVMHSPVDDTVGIDNATKIFVSARHPKSFVSLDRADHLLSKPSDAIYAADVIAAWAGRYVETAKPAKTVDPAEAPRQVIVQETRNGKFQQMISVHLHDHAPLRRPQVAAARPGHRHAEARQDPRKGLRGMRDARGHARPDRPGDRDGGRARSGAAQAADGDRRQVPGASDADVGDPHRHEGGGLTLLLPLWEKVQHHAGWPEPESG